MLRHAQVGDLVGDHFGAFLLRRVAAQDELPSVPDTAWAVGRRLFTYMVPPVKKHHVWPKRGRGSGADIPPLVPVTQQLGHQYRLTVQNGTSSVLCGGSPS
jgi:hypothetical protein